MMRWVSSGWAQRLTVNRVTSGWQPAITGVPQGFILGPVLFSVLINDLGAALEAILHESAGDTKLGEAADCLKGREALPVLIPGDATSP